MVDFLAGFTKLTSLPKRAGSNSDSLDHIPPAGEPGATTRTAQYDRVQTGKDTTTDKKERNENN